MDVNQISTAFLKKNSLPHKEKSRPSFPSHPKSLFPTQWKVFSLSSPRHIQRCSFTKCYSMGPPVREAVTLHCDKQQKKKSFLLKEVCLFSDNNSHLQDTFVSFHFSRGQIPSMFSLSFSQKRSLEAGHVFRVHIYAERRKEGII